MKYEPQVEGFKVSGNRKHHFKQVCFGSWLRDLSTTTAIEYKIPLDPTLSKEEKDYFLQFVRKLNEPFNNCKVLWRNKQFCNVLIRPIQDLTYVNFIRFWTTIFRFLSEFPEVVKKFHELRFDNETINDKLDRFSRINNKDAPKLEKYDNLSGHGFKRMWAKDITGKTYEKFVDDISKNKNETVERFINL